MMGLGDGAAAGSAGHRANFVLPDEERNTGQPLAAAAAQAPRIWHCLAALL